MANAELLGGAARGMVALVKYAGGNALHAAGLAGAHQEWKAGWAEGGKNGKRLGTAARRGAEGFLTSFLLPATYTAVTTSKGKLERSGKFVAGFTLDMASLAAMGVLIGVTITQPELSPLTLLLYKGITNAAEHILMDGSHTLTRRGKN